MVKRDAKSSSIIFWRGEKANNGVPRRKRPPSPLADGTNRCCCYPISCVVQKFEFELDEALQTPIRKFRQKTERCKRVQILEILNNSAN